MTIITDSRCTEYSAPGHPERPFRVAKSVERLKTQTDLPVKWAEPGPVSREQLLRAHTEEHLDRLEKPMDFDADTPAHPGIAEHARRAAGSALKALELALQGESAFSLMRPPGHHATTTRAMGFCYLNSIAVAAVEALHRKRGRVAVFDFDVHHGNGTEDILLQRSDCEFYSVHIYPAYPGTGEDSIQNARNYPVAPFSPRSKYRDILAGALEDLKRYRPHVLGVSAGFDGFAGDPLGGAMGASLLEEDFRWLGEELRSLNVPTFHVLEGGYSRELPDLILAYLKGFAGRPAAPVNQP
ncbi:MAG: histone deacetylase [Verrucomicrobia bacterium]|nr:histone deacetylase [Verrucomicrobiota bacterium]